MKKQYTAPNLTVVSVTVERGYASSDNNPALSAGTSAPIFLNSFTLSNNESPTDKRVVSDKWGDNPDDFWNEEF